MPSFTKKVNKIVSARGLISKATSMFTQAAKEIDAANSLLIEVKDAGNLEKSGLVERIADLVVQDTLIDAELKANHELKAQLTAFLPKA